MKNRLLYYWGRKLVRLYTEVMLKLDVVRLAPVPRGGKVVAVNHPTTTDPFVMTAVFREQAAILIKDVLFKVPLFGLYLKWAGHIPVVEGEKQKAMEKAVNFLKRGKTVIVFVEGDISWSEGKRPVPKTGAVRLALLTGAPIVPVGVAVRRENVKLIYSRVKGVRELGTWYFKGPYAVTVGKAMKVEGNWEEREKVKERSRRVMKKVMELARVSQDRVDSWG